MASTTLVVIVYAALVIVGGVIGFVKAGSRPSLIGGLFGGLGLLTAAWGIGRNQAWGLQTALVLTLALLVFFSVRYVRTRAFMPGGLMAILSLFALVITWLTAHGH